MAGSLIGSIEPLVEFETNCERTDHLFTIKYVDTVKYINVFYFAGTAVQVIAMLKDKPSRSEICERFVFGRCEQKPD